MEKVPNLTFIAYEDDHYLKASMDENIESADQKGRQLSKYDNIGKQSIDPIFKPTIEVINDHTSNRVPVEDVEFGLLVKFNERINVFKALEESIQKQVDDIWAIAKSFIGNEGQRYKIDPSIAKILSILKYNRDIGGFKLLLDRKPWRLVGTTLPDGYNQRVWVEENTLYFNDGSFFQKLVPIVTETATGVFIVEGLVTDP